MYIKKKQGILHNIALISIYNYHTFCGGEWYPKKLHWNGFWNIGWEIISIRVKDWMYSITVFTNNVDQLIFALALDGVLYSIYFFFVYSNKQKIFDRRNILYEWVLQFEECT